MSIGISTWCRRPDEGPDEFSRRAADLGAGSLVLDTRLPGGWVEALTSGWGKHRPALPVAAIEAPCPRPRAPRDPQLISRDREERRAAVEQVAATLELAAHLRAEVVLTRLGRLPIEIDWPRVALRFAEGRADAAEARRAWQLRLILAPAALDQARFALDPLLDRAAELGVTLALVNRARWFELPDEADLGVLLEEFSGAPLAAWYDPAAAHARAALGHGEALAFARTMGPRLAGSFRSDAAGLLGGLPWGAGEVDHAAVSALTAPAYVHCRPGVLEHELGRALRP